MVDEVEVVKNAVFSAYGRAVSGTSRSTISELPGRPTTARQHPQLLPRVQSLYNVIATWEGAGEFSFGGEFDAVTRRYTSVELVEAAAAAELGVMDVSIQVIGGMGIDAVLLWAAKASVSARAS